MSVMSVMSVMPVFALYGTSLCYSVFNVTQFLCLTFVRDSPCLQASLYGAVKCAVRAVGIQGKSVCKEF
jgi:hypothetical protein